MTGHIVQSYDENLASAKALIARMFGLSEQALQQSMAAIVDRNTTLASEVIAADKILDQLALEAEDIAVSILVRRSPVANDLRETIAIMKIASVIERMGDYAKNMAKRVHALDGSGYFATPDCIRSMYAEMTQVHANIASAYVEMDAKHALQIWKQDKYLDDLHNIAYRDLVDMMVSDSQLTGTLTHFLMIAKNLERMGDQATNIADIIHYVSTGEYIGQDRPKRDETPQTLID